MNKNLPYIDTQNQLDHPILPVLLELRKKGYEETTLKGISANLGHLNRNTDLHNPTTTLEYIINKKCRNAYKNKLLTSYGHFLEHYKIEYHIPRLKSQSKSIKTPLTKQIDTLIASARYPLNIKLMLLKETGLRLKEFQDLKTNDFDTTQSLIYPTTAKGGNPRKLKITNELTALLKRYIQENNREPNQSLFNTTTKSLRNAYIHLRRRTAKKLSQPELDTIRLYDFRHYFATMLYNNTKDILYVKQQMGHKSINSTLVYTQLIAFDEQENFTVRVAKTIEEDTELLEKGFTFITSRDNMNIYKKRK